MPETTNTYLPYGLFRTTEGKARVLLRRPGLAAGIAIVLTVFFCATESLCAQAEVGSIEIQTDVELTSEGNRGQRGIRVDVNDVVIQGYAGRLLTFTLAATKADGKDVLSDYYNFEPEGKISAWEQISYELTASDLQNLFGKGSHQLYIVFNIHTMQNENVHMIPGAYHVKQVRVNLQMEDLVSKHEVDRNYNEEIIRAKARTDPDYRALLELARKYNLFFVIREFTIGTKSTKEMYEWDFLTDADDRLLLRYIAVLLEHWNKLPVDFVEKTGLKAIVFVKNVYYSGLDVGAGFDVSDRFIICEVNDFFREEHILNAFYHEYMHMMDSVFYQDRFFANEQWAKLNPPGTEYTQKGALDMIRENRDFVVKEHPKPGFLNGYCLADIYQDKAEIFSYLLIPQYYRKAERWMKRDPYLAAKFRFMREALRHISSGFTEQFFNRINSQE